MILAALALLGCVHTVEIDSDPPGAAVRLDGRLLGYTPVTAQVRWKPAFTKDYDLVVRLTDHRTLRTSLREEVRLWRPVWQPVRYPIPTLRGCPDPSKPPRGAGACPDHSLKLVLVPEHGAAGEWTPDEVL